MIAARRRALTDSSSAQILEAKEQWKALPAAMEIRLIRFHFEDRDGKKRRMVLATTLMLTATTHAAAALRLEARTDVSPLNENDMQKAQPAENLCLIVTQQP